MSKLNDWVKLVLLCLLLLLALGLLIFAGVQTYQQIRSFQQRSRAVNAGDVNTVRPWMTIQAVSHIYHVPENYLYHELQVSNPASMRHATLSTIASNRRQPVNNVIRTVQHAIIKYRNEHPHPSTPTPTPHSERPQPLSERVGRWGA